MKKKQTNKTQQKQKHDLDLDTTIPNSILTIIMIKSDHDGLVPTQHEVLAISFQNFRMKLKHSHLLKSELSGFGILRCLNVSSAEVFLLSLQQFIQ